MISESLLGHGQPILTRSFLNLPGTDQTAMPLQEKLPQALVGAASPEAHDPVVQATLFFNDLPIATQRHVRISHVGGMEIAIVDYIHQNVFARGLG